MTLKPGTYVVRMGVCGNGGETFTVKAGEETVCSAATQGWWFEEVGAEYSKLRT